MSDNSSRAVAKLETGSQVTAIVPRNVEEVFRLAAAIVKAKLAPDSYDNDPEKVTVGIMKGAEVGLAPITALSTIAIINKRPCIWGDGAVALCQASGLVEEVKSWYEGEEDKDGWTAVFRIKRKGQEEPYEGRFSVKDAKRAQLWLNTKKQPWIQYPKRMLFNRARAFALRDGFADCLAGLGIVEEVRDIPAEPTPVDKSFLDDDTGNSPQITDQNGEEDAVDAMFEEGDQAEKAALEPAEDDDDTFPGDLPFRRERDSVA